MTYQDLVRAHCPAAYWPLQEAAGSTTAADVSGNGHMATATYWAPGDPTNPATPVTFGASGPFSGQVAMATIRDTTMGPDVAGYLEVASPGTLPVGASGSCSWEMWLSWTNPNPGGLLFGCPLATYSTVAINPGADAGTFLLEYNPTAAGGLSAGTFDVYGTQAGTSYEAYTTGGAAIGTWHHVVWVWDGTADTIYVDGVAASLAIDRPPALWWSNVEGITQAYNCTIGSSTTEGWFGSIAHVALYGCALPAAHVQSHYNLATTGTYTDPGPSPCCATPRRRPNTLVVVQ